MSHKLLTLKLNHERRGEGRGGLSTDINAAQSSSSPQRVVSLRCISRLTQLLMTSLALSSLVALTPLSLNSASAKPKLVKSSDNKSKAKSKSKTKAKPKARSRVRPKTVKRIQRPKVRGSRNRLPARSGQRLRQVKSVAKPRGRASSANKSGNARSPRRVVKRAGSDDSQFIKAGRQRSRDAQANTPSARGGSLVNTRTPVNGPARRSAEERRGQAGRAAQPGSKTTTTTTKTTKTKRVERSSRSSKRTERRRRRVERRRARRRARRDRGGSGGASRAGAPSYCRPSGGRTMLNFGVGTQSLDSDERAIALSIGGGYRSGLLGIAAEAQLANREEEEAKLSALRGQFRLYLPIGACADLYPLIGLSSFHGDRDNTYAIDLGLGADFNIGGSVSLGARYTHSFFTDRISDINNEDVESVNTFIVQVGVYF